MAWRLAWPSCLRFREGRRSAAGKTRSLRLQAENCPQVSATKLKLNHGYWVSCDSQLSMREIDFKSHLEVPKGLYQLVT